MTTVSTSGFYDAAIYNMTSLQTQMNQLQTSISTGDKYASANADPGATAQLRTLTLGDQLATANTANATAAKASLSLADTTLSQISTMVTQVQTLATQAATGTLSDSQRANIGVQIGQLYQNLVGLANTRDSNGQAIFAGTGGGAAYTTDAAGNATYAGTSAANTVALGGGLSVTTGITGPEVFDAAAGGTAQNLLATIGNLATALQNTGGSPTPQAAARASLDQLTAGLAQVSTAQTIVGARENWVTTTATIQTQLDQQRTTSEAAVGGTDIAAAVSRLQQTSTVLTAAQATFVKVAGMSLFAMLS